VKRGPTRRLQFCEGRKGGEPPKVIHICPLDEDRGRKKKRVGEPSIFFSQESTKTSSGLEEEPKIGCKYHFFWKNTKEALLRPLPKHLGRMVGRKNFVVEHQKEGKNSKPSSPSRNLLADGEREKRKVLKGTSILITPPAGGRRKGDVCNSPLSRKALQASCLDR